jgi:hypothetical protein
MTCSAASWVAEMRRIACMPGFTITKACNVL